MLRSLVVVYVNIVLARAFYHCKINSFGFLKGASLDNVEMDQPFGNVFLDLLWKLPIFRPSRQGTSPTTFGDAAKVLKYNILEVYGNKPSIDGAPIAKGEVKGLLEGSLFLGLQAYFNEVANYCTQIVRHGILLTFEI